MGEDYNHYFTWVFGSSHVDVVNMGMCDGSVRAIHFDIDLNVHWCMANREDGKTVNVGDF
jgi:prepilin-type processing-associated H-X9-DG protein